MPTTRLTKAQIHWFRLRRSGLVKPLGSIEQAAHQLIGIQAQMLPAANVAFWNRATGCTLAVLEGARLTERTLVRFWGQRDTVHMFASKDWPLLHAALAERQSLLRNRLEKAGVLADFRRLVARTGKKLAGRTLTYDDVSSKSLQAKLDTLAIPYVVFMNLVRDGVACHGREQGAHSHFVHREDWLPDLEWAPPSADEAHAELALRYLAAYGPAQAHDLAFWFGTTLAKARQWLDGAAARCRLATVDGDTFWYRKADQRALLTEPPTRSRWPVRLLYRFDPLLLGTKDKSWLIDSANYKKVWRAAAHVEPVLLVAGRIQGTWRYDRRARGIDIRVKPFKKLTRTVEGAVERQARSLARFLELPLGGLILDD